MNTQKPCDEMDFNEFVDWAAGYILLQLIAGKFRDGVFMVCSQAASNKVWGGSKPKEKGR